AHRSDLVSARGRQRGPRRPPRGPDPGRCGAGRRRGVGPRVVAVSPRRRLGEDGAVPLPGQDTPGLGLAREIGELLARIASRLGLEGVAFRPAWYHTAYAARHYFHFADPARQGRFEA